MFAGFVIAALLAYVINPLEAGSTKEQLLLVASLAGYIACRPMLAEDVAVVRSAFERITAVIVLAGAAFTAAEIIRMWDGPPGKPFVFGFNAAGTYFMASLSFLVIALVTVDRPRPKRTAVISALIFFLYHLCGRHGAIHVPCSSRKFVRRDDLGRARQTLARSSSWVTIFLRYRRRHECAV